MDWNKEEEQQAEDSRKWAAKEAAELARKKQWKEYQIKEVFKVGNRAKEVGDYVVANAATAWLLKEFFGLHVVRPGAHPDLYLEWETKDDSGLDLQEVYYDLLVVQHYHEDLSLCIPAPLLNLNTATAALKAASKETRQSHKRERRQPREGSHGQLWYCLTDILGISMEEFRSAVEDHLNRQENETLFKEVHGACPVCGQESVCNSCGRCNEHCSSAR